MFRSLQLKLVLILVLIMVSIMVVIGTFLINSVGIYYLDEFSGTVSSEFSANTEFVTSLRNAADEENAPDALFDVLRVYSGALGIDLYTRNYYILDGRTGGYITGSDPDSGAALDVTPNILTAVGGSPGYSRSITAKYIDAAVPFEGDGGSYIVYLRDNRARASELSTELFMLILEALLFGLVISVLLSFLLSKTITTPIEGLIASASDIARGDFSKHIEVRSADEIGILTATFNEMAEQLAYNIETVKNERDKLETLFLRMTDGVCAFDRDGAAVQMNPAARRMLGLDLDSELTYAKLFEHILPFENATKQKPPSFFEAEVTRSDLILKINISPYGEREGTTTGVMAVIHDITEQTRLELTRREFVANVSHELRTPLTNVKSYTETLFENDDLDRETQKNFLSVVSGETDRMSRIVSDLLTLSRFDHDGIVMTMRRVRFLPIIERVCDAMRLEADHHKHNMTLDIINDPGDVNCDPERIEQVLVNIISNAIKYTPAGGNIAIALNTEAEYLCVSVADNGVGIPSNSLKRLFERFYRVDKARSREAGGSGLGLAIAKEIVDRHGGDIEIRSTYGRGTTAFLRLPLLKDGETA